MNDALSHTGAIPLPPEAESRHALACRIAGVLAELSVGALRVSDPRTCQSRTLSTRQTNLPAELLSAAPGTIISNDRVALHIEHDQIAWASSASIGQELRTLSTPPAPGQDTSQSARSAASPASDPSPDRPTA